MCVYIVRICCSMRSRGVWVRICVWATEREPTEHHRKSLPLHIAMEADWNTRSSAWWCVCSLCVHNGARYCCDDTRKKIYLKPRDIILHDYITFNHFAFRPLGWFNLVLLLSSYNGLAGGVWLALLLVARACTRQCGCLLLVDFVSCSDDRILGGWRCVQPTAQ